MSRRKCTGLSQVGLAASLALLLAVLVLPAGAASGPTPPRAIETVVGCLFSRPVQREVLKDLSLKLGKFANVRYYQGSMPSVPQSGGYYILIYSPNTKLAWLLIARPSIHGRVWPYRGAFNYQREGGRLRVVEGFGGLGTYKTYGDFARQMEAHEPLIHVRLDPCSECCGPLPDV